jgi:hypothetical protein
MRNKTHSELDALSQRVGKLLRAFGETRARQQMAADEVLVFLALGCLAQAPNSHDVSVRRVTRLELAEVLNIPKETVRRKVARLAEMQLVEATTYGIFVQDEDEWRRLAEMIAP